MMSQMFGIRYHGVINFNDKMKMDVVGLVSYQNSVSNKIMMLIEIDFITLLQIETNTIITMKKLLNLETYLMQIQ